MIRPERFSHAVLFSHDAKKTMDWYVEVTNGHVIFETEGLAFMTFDGEHHRLGVMQLPPETPRPEAGQHLSHLAFAYATIGDLIATYERLRERRIYPRITVNHGLTLSNYYQDPDGNGVELLVDLLPPDEASALMCTPYFTANPVGLLLNAEELARRVAEGVTAEELTAEYEATTVDIPTLMARIAERRAPDDEAYATMFEAEIAASR